MQVFKRCLLVVALLGLLVTQVNAYTDVIWANVWLDHQFYDNHFYNTGEDGALRMELGLSDPNNPSDITVSANLGNGNSYPLPYDSADGNDHYWSNSFYFPQNLSDWTTSYDFDIIGDMGPSPPIITFGDGDLRLLPYAIPTFSGGVASWDPVSTENGDQILYRIQLYQFYNGYRGPREYKSDFFDKTSFDIGSLLGPLGLEPEDFVIILEAREYFGDNFYSRSRYNTVIRDAQFAAPVPEPATMLLLGVGLVGLAGFGRKKFFKK